MTPEIVHTLIDQLLARDQQYRPVELLILLRRLDRPALSLIEREPDSVLEDHLYGDPERALEQLNWAAKRARSLGLTPHTEARPEGQGQFFRRATADHLTRTVWTRSEDNAQADLFLDSGLSRVRRDLTRALKTADRDAAEALLVDLAHSSTDNELQADAEHLVGALVWLEDRELDVAGILDSIDNDLAARARRLLGPRDANSYLSRFYKHLAQCRAANAAADEEPSAAQLYLQAGDPAAALEALDQQAGESRRAALYLVELRASLALDHRERALQALSCLCWIDPEAADQWLEQGEDEELSRRVEQFWDLENPLETGLFPAWLLARGYPMPTIDMPPDIEQARALEAIRSLRQDPGSIEARAWLQSHFPDLMTQWMRQRD